MAEPGKTTEKNDNKISQIFMSYKDQTIKKIRNYFDFFNKILIEMYENVKIPPFYTQKYEVLMRNKIAKFIIIPGFQSNRFFPHAFIRNAVLFSKINKKR